MEHCVHRISRACQPKNVDVYDADLYDTVEAMAAPKTADQKKNHARRLLLQPETWRENC